MTAGAGRHNVFLAINSELLDILIILSNMSVISKMRLAGFKQISVFFQEFRFLRAKTIIFVYFVNPVHKIRVSEVLLEATHTQNDHRGLNRSPGPQLVIFTFLSVTDNHTNSIEPLKR